MKLISAIAITLFFNSAIACDCVVRSLPELYGDADVIFLGEVVNTTVDSCKTIKPNGQSNFCGPNVLQLRPYEVFKQSWDRLGNAKAGFKEIYILQDGTNCEWPMKQGGKYLIFGKAATWNVFTTNQCAGTGDASNAAARIQKLRKLRAAFEEAEKP